MDKVCPVKVMIVRTWCCSWYITPVVTLVVLWPGRIEVTDLIAVENKPTMCAVCGIFPYLMDYLLYSLKVYNESGCYPQTVYAVIQLYS